jgi:signal transduction histidine kinase
MEAQPEGGEIIVSAIADGTQLTIDFSDSGPGVPEDQRSEIFEFGKTTKIGGSGIGLPLSQLIVESHGGSLVCQARNGSGATFRMQLPMEAVN